MSAQSDIPVPNEINEILEDPSIVMARKPSNLFDKITVNFYSIVCFTMSILLMLIISLATLARHILQLDLYGYEEWIKIFAFWLYFIGASYGAFAGTHISADLVQSYMRDGYAKRFLILLRTVITLCITLVFTWYGWKYFYFGLRGPLGTGIAIPKTVAWRIPMWTAYLAVFVGLVSMSYYFFWDMIKAGKQLLQGGRKY